jgi:hypothetical protein
MSFPKAVVTYELNTESFIPAANTATTALNTISDKTKRTADDIAKLEEKVTQSKIHVAASFTGMASSVASFAFSIDDLGKKQLAADRIALQITKKQNEYNKALAEGKESAQQLKIREEELRILREKHKNAVQDITQATTNLIFTMATMGTVTIPTTIASIRSMQAAQHALAAAQTVTTETTVSQTAANVGLTASFRQLTVAMMSNPLGIALVAGSIGALAAYQTNLFGVKDKVDSLMVSFGGMSQQVQQVDTTIQTGIPAMDDYADSVRSVGVAAGATAEELKKMMGTPLKPSELKFSFDKIHESILGISAAIRGIDQGTPFENLTKSTDILFQFLHGVKLTTEEQKINYLLMKDQIIPTLEDLGQAWARTGKSGEEKFLRMLKELQKEGKLSAKELKDLTEAIRGVNQELDKSKKKLDPKNSFDPHKFNILNGKFVEIKSNAHDLVELFDTLAKGQVNIGKLLGSDQFLPFAGLLGLNKLIEFNYTLQATFGLTLAASEALRKGNLVEARRLIARAKEGRNIVSSTRDSFTSLFLSGVSQRVTSIFRDAKPFGDSVDSILAKVLPTIPGIPQGSDLSKFSQRLKVTNPRGRIGATATISPIFDAANGLSPGGAARFVRNTTRSGLTRSKGKSSRHGGEKGPSRETQILTALGYVSTPYNTSYYRDLAMRNLQLILDEGLPEPRTPAEASALLAEAQRRKAERERQQREAAAAAGISVSEFITLSQTQQGQIDIAGMTLYRQLAGYGG